MKRLIVALAALLIAAAPAVTVPPAEIAAEDARWTSMGVKLPPGGIVIAHPYSPPYSVHSFVVPSSWYRDFGAKLKANPDLPVDASALREDLPTLAFLMEHTYAGYETAKLRHHWNWNAWFSQWDKSLARAPGTLPLSQAFAPWGKLEDVQLDNHSGVSGSTRFVSGSQSAVLASKPQTVCTALRTAKGAFALSSGDKGQQPHAVQEWNGTSFAPAWYISYPKRDGDAETIRCGGNIALHLVAPAAAPGEAAYETLADGIAYVRMPAFTDAAVESLRASLAKAPGLGKERVVVLDLRGNQGGNAPTDILSTWFAQSAVDQAADLRQIGTQSCFRTALFFGLQQQLALGLKPPVSAGVTQFLQQIVDTLKAPVSCSVEPQISQGSSTLADHRFQRHYEGEQSTRLIALVDNGCGSDCEYIATIIGNLPGTVIAGSSTYGVMGFTQPGYFVLPRSRVAFRLALSRTDAYGDDRSVDGYGITVDVLLRDAASQQKDSLLALARALLN